MIIKSLQLTNVLFERNPRGQTQSIDKCFNRILPIMIRVVIHRQNAKHWFETWWALSRESPYPFPTVFHLHRFFLLRFSLQLPLVFHRKRFDDLVRHYYHDEYDVDMFQYVCDVLSYPIWSITSDLVLASDMNSFVSWRQTLIYSSVLLFSVALIFI
mgnify:FL=1